MTQFGFFDLEYRLDKIDKNGDPPMATILIV